MLKRYDARNTRNLKVKDSFEDFRKPLTRRLIGSTSQDKQKFKKEDIKTNGRALKSLWKKNHVIP